MNDQGNHLGCNSYADWYKSESEMWLKGSTHSSSSESSGRVELVGIKLTKKMKKKGFYRDGEGYLRDKHGAVIYCGTRPA